MCLWLRWRPPGRKGLKSGRRNRVSCRAATGPGRCRSRRKSRSRSHPGGRWPTSPRTWRSEPSLDARRNDLPTRQFISTVRLQWQAVEQDDAQSTRLEITLILSDSISKSKRPQPSKANLKAAWKTLNFFCFPGFQKKKIQQRLPKIAFSE